MITSKKKREETPPAPEFSVAALVEEYAQIAERAKVLEKRKKEIADRIKTISMTSGSKDDKGSFYIESERFVCGAVAKKTVSMNEDRAEAYFKSKNLWDDVKITTERVDEARVEYLLAQGTITNTELEPLLDVNTSFSVMVKLKEEMPTIDTQPLVKGKKVK